MASNASVQVFIDDHHRKCVKALQLIAQLADTGSDEHKRAFPDMKMDWSSVHPVHGWRVSEKMREVALDALGIDGDMGVVQ